MALSKWGNEYSLGDREIDEQHRELFEMTQRITSEIAGGSLNVVDELSSLMMYASEHFHSEEALMRRIGYPGLNAHRLGHAVFVRELMNLVTEVQSGSILDCACLGEYAATWMRSHVLTGDMDIRRFLIQGR
jgi:hemerythrin-like metal-binding protein